MSQWRDYEEPETYQQPVSPKWSYYERPETSTRLRLSQTEMQRKELKKKSFELMEETNRAFKELTSTLSNDQIRLTELEEKRKHLLHQMLSLKADIEKEREACRLELQEVADDESVNVETWHGCPENEILRKKSSVPHRSSEGTIITQKAKNYKDYDQFQSREEITNDIVNRLTEFAKRSSNSSY